MSVVFLNVSNEDRPARLKYHPGPPVIVRSAPFVQYQLRFTLPSKPMPCRSRALLVRGCSAHTQTGMIGRYLTLWGLLTLFRLVQLPASRPHLVIPTCIESDDQTSKARSRTEEPSCAGSRLHGGPRSPRPRGGPIGEPPGDLPNCRTPARNRTGLCLQGLPLVCGKGLEGPSFVR